MRDFNSALTLIAQSWYDSSGNPRLDENGNQVAEETKTTVRCAVSSVRMSEFYKAATEGIKAEVMFIIHPLDFANQEEVEFNGERYTVVRHYAVDYERLELIVKKRVGDG